MLLLITTPRFVLQLDAQTGRSAVLESGQGEYSGLTWSPSGKHIAIGCSGIDASGMVDLATYALSEHGYLVVDGKPSWPFLSAPHQILWADDDTILVANTGRNALARVNAKDFSIVQYRYDDVLWDQFSPDGRQGAHLNSILRLGERVYVVAHNHDRGSYILELAWPSLEKIDVHAVEATGIHNLCITPDGVWLCCDSANGTLIDARTGRLMWSNQQQGYSKGLAVTSDYVFVGNAILTKERAMRRIGETGVWVIDAKTWKTLDYLLPGFYGGIGELRVADVPDLAHHGKTLNPAALGSLGGFAAQTRAIRLADLENRFLDAKRWRLCVGGPLVVDDSGEIVPPEGAFALAVARDFRAQDGAVAASIAIRTWREDGYIGLIGRYGGPGDSTMCAGLLQIDKGILAASIWENDGATWRMLTERVIGSHLEARPESRIALRFDVRGQKMTLRVNGETFVETPSSAPVRAGQFGIRTLGRIGTLTDVEVIP